jgi:hypothetical protein
VGQQDGGGQGGGDAPVEPAGGLTRPVVPHHHEHVVAPPLAVPIWPRGPQVPAGGEGGGAVLLTSTGSRCVVEALQELQERYKSVTSLYAHHKSVRTSQEMRHRIPHPIFGSNTQGKRNHKP